MGNQIHFKMNLTKQTVTRKNAVFFFFLVLSGFANFTFAQTPAAQCGTNQCQSITSFSDCGSNVYQATMSATANDGATFKVQVGGSQIKCLGYSATNANYTGDWISACGMSGLYLQTTANPRKTTYYLRVNTSTNNITVNTTSGVTGITSSSGLPTGVTASYSSNTVTISGTPTSSGTYNYTIDVTGCDDDATGTIVVRSAFTDGDITTTGETICYGGTPASTIGNSVSASGGDNSITYSWRSS